MSRRAATAKALVASFALVLCVIPHVALASAHHGAGFGGREAGLGIGIGRGIIGTHSLNPVRLNIPAPNLLRDRQPTVKPTRDPFPDFNVPLRRHRMAIPDSAIPALGDLSF